MPCKNQAWDTISLSCQQCHKENFKSSQRASLADYRWSLPQSRLWLKGGWAWWGTKFSEHFSCSCCSYGKQVLKPKRNSSSMFQFVWRNICCFDFLIFIAHKAGILGHKVTLRSHFSSLVFNLHSPLAILHIKRWMGTCECLNLIWFGLWMFPVCQCCCGWSKMACSNSGFNVWFYESDPLKHTALHHIALQNLALLLHSYLLFPYRAYPFLFQDIGPETP